MSVIYTGERFNADVYKIEPTLSKREWFEKNIEFKSRDVSPILGYFKLKYSPHYPKLLDLADRLATREMFGKWASQAGKSLMSVGICAEKLDQDPSTIIYAQPIKDDVPKILTLKINPVLKSMPKLWKKFEDYSDQEKFRTKDAMKRVAGGALVVSGSSVKERKSLSAHTIVADEIGEFEEGSIAELKERSKAFSRFNPLFIGVSTIVHPNDEICTNFNSCEIKIEWHFECRECGGHFYPEDFEYPKRHQYAKNNDIALDKVIEFQYVNYASQEVHIKCPHCEHKIYEDERTDMILNGSVDWFQKLEDGTYARFEIENLTDEASFGFDMNSLGSYFATLPDMVRERIKAEDDDVKMDKFCRGYLNKFHNIKYEESSSDDMLSLGNGYQEWDIPEDTYKLYCGVDVQKDHFWLEV